MHLKMTSTLIRAKKKTPINPNDYWYDPVPMGKNKVSCLLSEKRVEDGFEQYKRSHSLCATGASALFSAGVSETIIPVTDHSRCYDYMNLCHRNKAKIPPRF